MRHLIAIAGLVWPLLVSAQTSLPSVPVGVGDSVRVFMRSGGGLRGQVTRQTPDSLALRRGVDVGDADTVVALLEISRVDAKTRHHSVGSAFKGLGFAFVAGALAGAAVAMRSSENCHEEGCGFAMLAVPVFGVLGGLAGMLIGSFRTSEGWEEVWQGSAERR